MFPVHLIAVPSPSSSVQFLSLLFKYVSQVSSWIKMSGLTGLFASVLISVFSPDEQIRPYPREEFTDGDRLSSFSELGLASKQEALFLEFI